MLKKIFAWTICFLIMFSCSAIKSQIITNNEKFEKQFFMDKRFYSIIKQKFPNKNNIALLDSKQLISKEPLSFSNRDINIIIDSKDTSNYDLFVKYYKVNRDLAYVVFWANDNEAICFIIVKNDKNWSIADVITRSIR